MLLFEGGIGLSVCGRVQICLKEGQKPPYRAFTMLSKNALGTRQEEIDYKIHPHQADQMDMLTSVNQLGE